MARIRGFDTEGDFKISAFRKKGEGEGGEGGEREEGGRRGRCSEMQLVDRAFAARSRTPPQQGITENTLACRCEIVAWGCPDSSTQVGAGCRFVELATGRLQPRETDGPWTLCDQPQCLFYLCGSTMGPICDI